MAASPKPVSSPAGHAEAESECAGTCSKLYTPRRLAEIAPWTAIRASWNATSSARSAGCNVRSCTVGGWAIWAVRT
eukprot:261193-Chlamydomonas_euryale.AAC.1